VRLMRTTGSRRAPKAARSDRRQPYQEWKLGRNSNDWTIAQRTRAAFSRLE
jgi:hypothetical protein